MTEIISYKLSETLFKECQLHVVSSINFYRTRIIWHEHLNTCPPTLLLPFPLPTSLQSLLSSFLPGLHSVFLPFFLPSILPTFLPPFLPSRVPSVLPLPSFIFSCLPFSLPPCQPAFLASLLPSIPPLFLPSFLYRLDFLENAASFITSCVRFNKMLNHYYNMHKLLQIVPLLQNATNQFLCCKKVLMLYT